MVELKSKAYYYHISVAPHWEERTYIDSCIFINPTPRINTVILNGLPVRLRSSSNGLSLASTLR